MINLETLNTKKITDILKENKIEYIIEDEQKDEQDVEIQIKHNSEDDYSLYVKMDHGNNTLRLYGINHNILRERRKNLEGDELHEVINMINIGSNVIKYSTISHIALTFEYGIPLFGKISEDHFVHALEFIIDEVAVLGNIFDEFHKIVKEMKK
ncbi:hypothetical protein MM798_004720 [Escherichia coli]|nr:hypothetical protein [Escherichia coli]